MQTFDNVPLWLFFVTVLIVSLLWTECGFRIGQRRRKKQSDESGAPLGTIVASILALLAFLLAFTFNLACNRFDDRRAAVLNEANAIGTTYLRADFFDDPEKGQIKKLLREYVQVRVGGTLSRPRVDLVISQSEALQDKLWSTAATLAREHQGSPICALFISSLNDVIDMHAKRITLGLYARVPLSVWIVLFVVSALSLAAVGFYCGMCGSRSWAEVFILITVFTLVMFLVADLDRPQEGFIKASQQPMIDLQQKLGQP
jgi:hypothetical protein